MAARDVPGIFRFGCPTLVLWRGAYGVGLQQRFRRVTAILVRSAHGLIRCLLPFRDVLFAKSLSDLCGVWAENMECNSQQGNVVLRYRHD